MRSSSAGVTLIEMLVVVTIIALFATLATPPVIDHLERSKAVKARVQITSFEQALTLYKLDNGVFPNGLEALRANALHGASPYLVKEIPLDPWRHPYVYRFPGEHGSQPDIISYGADGQPGGDGPNADIMSWKN